MPGAVLFALTTGASEPTQATVITSDTLDMRGGDTETVSVFDGHVVVVGTGLRLTCDHLEVVSVRIGDKDDTIGQQDRFKSLIALGNVHIIQGEREATCGRADVRPRENKITLTENPVVKDNGNGTMASGDELVMLRGDRQVHGKNVKITAPPIRDLGADAKPSAGDAPRK
jgi:lipopolysaccharide export system protein LptA